MEKTLSPTMLPIAKYQEDILNLIDGSPAVVISGKTGCGKSTQVPQYILNRHPDAKVVICQPRRVAATSLAVRVSEELKCKLGKKVGYHIGMQSFKEENCSIIYMTYGILIQQLLFKDNLKYTHIILDQIHERSLEMDFTFVALKKMINDKYKNKIKLIVMSATLNADLFCNYFATNDEGKFYLCQLRQAKGVQQQSRRGGRLRGDENEDRQHFEVLPAGKQFKPALKLQLQQQKLFKVQQYYLQDLKENKQFYYGQQEQRIPDQMYRIAVEIIKETKAEGDYLIFLPGLCQIRTLKSLLVSCQFDPNRIIQVHSLFSDELYHHLFNPNIKNKLILATNIGQSSITLPFCCVVIDFCLSRKNQSRDRGVTRLQTRLASQANLIQRSGRVGRVSDGKVYRLITKQLYNQLPQYQKPEIQCVSLEMTILRVKQLDFKNSSQFFKNPYYFLMSTINPPEIHQIRKSLKILIEQEALVGTSSKSINIGNSQQLLLTEMGRFMVQMPCELRISKVVLMGLQLRIPRKIINIACILMLSKQFFLHEQRRQNIEEFMHSLVGYDQGNFNDYLLRSKIFSHWKDEFYEKTKQKRLFMKKKFIEPISNQGPQIIQKSQRVYEIQESAQELQVFVQEFSQQKLSEKQIQWCSNRGISPNIMRQLIKHEENLRSKLISARFQLPSTEEVNNQLVLLCLLYGFPEGECDAKWPYLKQSDFKQYFFIELPNIKQTHDDILAEYIKPEKDYKIEDYIDRKRIYGSVSVLSKFILPKHYSKAQTKNTSSLYQYLSKKNISHTLSSQFTLRGRPITILNESICKSSLPAHQTKKYKLVTHKFLEIGNKKLVGMSALVEQQAYLMSQLILRKNVFLLLHPSRQYFCGFKINQDTYSITTILDQPLINDILFYRRFMSTKKQIKVDSVSEGMSQQDVSKLYKLLKAHGQQLQREVWEWKYQIDVRGPFKDEYFPIENLPKLMPRTNYHEDYKNWKLKKYYQFYNEYRPLIMDSIYLICRECTKQITQIEHLSFYNHANSVLKLNQYSGNWKIREKKLLTCIYGHQVGEIVSQEEAIINKKSIMLYIPFNQKEELWESESWKSEEQIKQMIKLGREEIQNRKNQLQHNECIFCYEPNQGNEGKKYMDHTRTQQHLNNIQKFKSNLNLSA